MATVKYVKGDKVWWWSEQGGKAQRSKAVFLRYDKDFPDEDCILAFRVGPSTIQTFRWPLKLTEPLSTPA